MTSPILRSMVTATIVAVTMLSLTSCAPSHSSYLAMGGDEGRLCVPASSNEGMVLGETVQAEADISIESVELVGAEGLRTLDEASVISLENGATAIGAQRLSDLEADTGGPWSAKVPANSAQLKSGTYYSVTVVVELEGASGHADRMKVTYLTDDGQTHSAEGTTSYQLAKSC